MAKACTKCEQVKPLDEFYANKRCLDGHVATCKECVLRRCKEHYVEHKDKHKARRLRYLAQISPEKLRDIRRKTHLKKAYGMTLEEYKRLGELRDWRCEVCGLLVPYGMTKQDLCLDHDHTTGRIRGMLCGPCNIAIGFLRDDPALLRKAADYLEREGDIHG